MDTVYRDLIKIRKDSQRKILVVEDDPFWRRLISSNVSNQLDNYSLSFASNAASAMKRIEADPNYDLIIADQYLDGSDTGYDLWSDCRQKGIFTPFLLTSGQEELPELSERITHPRFVPKRFLAGELRSCLDPSVVTVPVDEFLHFGEFHPGLPWVVLITLAGFLIAIPLVTNFQPHRPPAILAPPPAIDLYKPPFGNVAHASPQSSQIITPSLRAKVALIVQRADEILAWTEFKFDQRVGEQMVQPRK
jgi:CheY-like chemotaxis protein